MPNPLLKLLKPGQTFKCGKNGRITGTIVVSSDHGDDLRHNNADPEEFGYIYTLDQAVDVWKGARRREDTYRYRCELILIPLRIPAGTLIRAGYRPAKGTDYRGDGNSVKCRAAQALVLPYKGGLAHSDHDERFKYNRGTIVKPDGRFDMDPSDQCSSGIHFFFNKNEVSEYFGCDPVNLSEFQ